MDAKNAELVERMKVSEEQAAALRKAEGDRFQNERMKQAEEAARLRLELTTRNWRTIVQRPAETPPVPTPNTHYVTYEKRDMRLTIGRVMTRVMTPAEALNLAAWLVRHADPDGSKFLPLLAGTFVQEQQK